MSLAKKAFYHAAGLIPLKTLQHPLPMHLLLPYHHLVNNTDVPHIKHLYPYKNERLFEQDVDYLLRHFKPVTLQEVIQASRGQLTLPHNAFLLTFDDGLREVAEVIVPLLRRKGVPAVFFLNNAFLDNRTLFYKFKISLLIEALQTRSYSAAVLEEAAALLPPDERGLTAALKAVRYSNKGLTDDVAALLQVSFEDYLKQQRPFMTTEEVKALLVDGFAIGGHSVDHPYYSDLTLEQQLMQTRESVEYLVNQFGIDYRVFAFPHSDAGVSRTFFDRLFQEENPMDLVFGTGNQRQDISPRILHRFNCERPSLPIEQAVKGILLYGRLKKICRQNNIHRN
ncbi:polysaccharide deacetylase family protein [Chitinophaga sp. G-6-1-13]|uniref:Polysaccharide deacetylase family protein n=1 Tax=Chitinophaga fulva TaxID=2728842 RepID=A0A848GQZ5_9BACT|nr:polysaccharide deacetylase family protein [Chitinophaga fulva]NML39060.1 polysaccharide deacetylase family protein [Chitinophaga fulva]